MIDLRELKGGRKRAREDPLASLKQAAQRAADALCDMMADENQFCRHVYADKASGAVTETLLNTRNVKHLRETVGAIRELAEVVRSLNDLMAPEEKRALEMQMEKLRLEEKKLSAAAPAGETGVVLLPQPEEDAHA